MYHNRLITDYIQMAVLAAEVQPSGIFMILNFAYFEVDFARKVDSMH